MLRTEAVIDLTAIAANTARLRSGTTAEVMAVVKADAYGHGLLPSARAALAGGATWLGTAILDEALALRAAGADAPTLAWLWTPDETATVERAVAAAVDLSVSSEWQLAAVVAAARAAGVTAAVHLKIDTGLSRNGAHSDDWPALVTSAAKAEAGGEILVRAVWSHFAWADAPGHPTIRRQLDVFGAALDVASSAGVRPPLRHIANSAATLTLPEAHFDLVRPGIAVYGLPPVPGDFGLVPAMTLRAAAASVKRIPAGSGVSYGHEYVTDRETTVVLVPLGYADGIPRHASNAGPVTIGGSRFRISGRVCMDQFVVDVGDLDVAPGDPVILFGADGGGAANAANGGAAADAAAAAGADGAAAGADGAAAGADAAASGIAANAAAAGADGVAGGVAVNGAAAGAGADGGAGAGAGARARSVPSARDWADAAGTIDYEIVTRVGPRVPRTYVGGPS